MGRIILGAIAGFIAWLAGWIGIEQLLSASWPQYGAHQVAFQAAIENGGSFTANPRLLLVHLVVAAIVSLASGYVSAWVARENRRAPWLLAILLLALGVLKAVMSWPYVPLWYHLGFTALLVPMAILGGRLKA